MGRHDEGTTMAGERVQRTKQQWTWHWAALIVAIAMMAIGVFVMVNPEATIGTISLVIGIVVVLRAILLIINGLRVKNTEDSMITVSALVFGVAVLIVGIILIARPEFASDALLYIAALVLIVDALANIALWPRLNRHNGAMLAISVIATAVVLAASIMLLVRPEFDWFTLPLGAGVALFGEGVNYALFGFASRGWLGRHQAVSDDRAPDAELETRDEEALES